MHPRIGLALRVAWDLVRIRFVHRGIRKISADAVQAGPPETAGAAVQPAEDGPKALGRP